MKKTLLFTTAFLITIISQAATFTVQNTNDLGVGSLRAEIGNTADGDTIRFNPALISGGNSTITLASEIVINSALTIIGLYNSTDTLFISGNNNSRIFYINAFTDDTTLDSLVLINGNGVGLTSSGIGGAIMINSGYELFLNNSIIRDNSAGHSGGAIAATAGFSSSVTIVNSIITGNTATNYGGGIHCGSGNHAFVTIINSTISENTAIDYDGGGIYTAAGNPGSGPYTTTVTITNSTINENIANNGGGIYSSSNSLANNCTSSINVTNSTFSGNIATANGGGIFISSDNTPVTIVSSIFEESSIDNNSVNSITSNGYNIFTDAPTGTVATDNINITPVAINLGQLANNGGTTLTRLPGTGSVAINMGDPTDMTDSQNRSVSGGRRDVGAAETTCLAITGNHDETVCFGDSITVNGTVYNASNLTGTEVFTNVGPNMCDSTVTVNLTVKPAIDITVDNSSAPTLTANQVGASYEWIDCNTGIAVFPPETNQSFTAPVNGNYAVVVTLDNCSATSLCENITGVGIAEATTNIVSIYPNPTNGVFSINLTNTDQAVSYTLTTLEGRIIEQANNITTNNIQVDLTNQSKGVYFLILNQANNTNTTYKIIRQ